MVVVNPYAETKKKRKLMEAALQPGMRQTTEQVASTVGRRESGKLGASLMREVRLPAQQAMAGFEVGEAQKESQFEAERPGYESRLASEALSREYVPKQFGLQERGQTEAERSALSREAMAGKQFEEGQRRFNTQTGQWEQQFGESGRRFDVGVGEREREFGEGQRRFNTQTGQWEQSFERGGEQFERQAKENQLNRLIQLAQDPTNTQAAAQANQLMQELYGITPQRPAPGVATPPTGRPVTAPAAQPAPQQGIVQPGPVGGVVGAQKDPAETKAKKLGFDDAYSMNLFMQSNPEDAAAIEDPNLKDVSIYDRGKAKISVNRLRDIEGDSGAREETLDIMKELEQMGYRGAKVGRYPEEWNY